MKLGEYDLDDVYCGDCVEKMKGIPENSVDLVVTSPPYDQIRDYKGVLSFDLHATGREIYRVLKDGGIAVVVIQDQTRNFGKSLTTFKTIIDWCDSVGFKLFETVIYRKHGSGSWELYDTVDDEVNIYTDTTAYINPPGGQILEGFLFDPS